MKIIKSCVPTHFLDVHKISTLLCYNRVSKSIVIQMSFLYFFFTTVSQIKGKVELCKLIICVFINLKKL